MNFIKEYKLFMQRIGLVGVTNILVAISSLILLPIITKNFSINDYGIWVQINTTIALIPNFASLGLPYTMVRFLSTEKNKKKIQEGFYSISIIVLISTIIISSLMFLFAKNIASALFNGNINLAILLSITIFFACLNAFLINFFRTFQQMKLYSIFLLIQTYLSIFIVSYFVISGFGIFIAASGLLTANFIVFFVMISFIILDIGLKFPKFKNLKEYLFFGLPTIPSNLSNWIVDSSDRYVIGIILGTTFVGYYSPGYTLGNILTMVIAPFSILLPSILPKYYDENDLEKVMIYLTYSLKYFLLIAIPSAFGLSVLSKPILMILTTPQIASNGYLITPFVALSIVLFGSYVIISNLIILKKKTKIIGSIWIVAAILNLGLNIMLVPSFGIIVAAIDTLIAFLFAFAFTLFYSLKYFKIDFNLIFILKSVTVSILMSFIILFINPYGVLNLVFTVGFSALFYITVLVILKGFKKEEINFIKEFFLSKIN